MKRFYEIRRRRGDGLYAVWRSNLEREGSCAWDCVAVFDDYRKAVAFRDGNKEH